MLYKRYVDDRYAKRKSNETDTIFDMLNSYHSKVYFRTKPNKVLRYADN